MDTILSYFVVGLVMVATIVTALFVLIGIGRLVWYKIYRKDSNRWDKCKYCGEAETPMYKIHGYFFSYYICGKRECWNKSENENKIHRKL